MAVAHQPLAAIISGSRGPPSLTPRALAAARAALVRSLIMTWHPSNELSKRLDDPVSDRGSRDPHNLRVTWKRYKSQAEAVRSPT